MNIKPNLTSFDFIDFFFKRLSFLFFLFFLLLLIIINNNCPFAGVELNFAIEVNEAREASATELEHEYVHDSDVHQH